MISLCLALTHHLLPGDWNQTHPCLRYEQGYFAAGAFYNSESSWSLTAGLIGRKGPFFLEGGVVTGYSSAPVLPFARAGIEWDRIKLFVMPAYEVNTETFGAVIGTEVTLFRW